MKKELDEIIEEMEKAKTIDDGHIGVALLKLYALRNKGVAEC